MSILQILDLLKSVFRCRSRLTKWHLIAMVVIAAVAMTAATVAWFQHAPKISVDNRASVTDSQLSESTKRLCDAYDRVTKAVEVNNIAASGDDMMRELIAVHQRQVFIVGEAYLSAAVQSSPAAPDKLVTAVQELISSYREIVLDGFLSDSSPAARAVANGAAAVIEDSCRR